MRLFTFVLDYRGGTYVQQVEAADAHGAVEAWIQAVELDEIRGLTAKSRTMFEEKFRGQELVPLSGMKNVWCLSATLRGGLALVHMIKTEL